MARTNRVLRSSQLENDALETESTVPYNLDEHGTIIKIRSKFPAHVKAIGKVSGNTYIWPQAGAIVEVQAEDVPQLLEWRIGEGVCCGGSGGPNQVLELV